MGDKVSAIQLKARSVRTALLSEATPANPLSQDEREAAMLVLNRNEFKNLPPSPIRFTAGTSPNCPLARPVQCAACTFTSTCIFSCKLVGWGVFERENAELAAQLLEDICERQGIPMGQLTVHLDNGSPIKDETMLATLQRLGVAHSVGIYTQLEPPC